MRATKTNNDLIFLVGLERSGTTWIGKIFDSHPETLYVHEPDSWYKELPAPLLTPPGYNDSAGKLSEYIKNLPNITDMKVAGKVPLFKKSYHNMLMNGAVLLNAYISRIAAKFSINIPTYRYINKNKLPELNVVWKSIESLGRLNYFSSVSDKIKIIHIIRHPCGAIASLLRGEDSGKFYGGVSTSDDVGTFELLSKTEQARNYNLTLDDFQKMTPLERLAWRWVIINEKAIEELRDLDNSLLLRYEDLCENPIDKTKEIFAFCDLSWNEQSEGFLFKSTHANRKQYFSVYKDPRESAYKWKKYLSSDDVEKVMSIVSNSNLRGIYT